MLYNMIRYKSYPVAKKLFKKFIMNKISISNSVKSELIEQETLKSIQIAQQSDFCAVVDENDKVIGMATKLACHKLNKDKVFLHRAFSVMLFNEEGKLLVQRRSKYKHLFPLCLTNTCCSHPRANCENEMEELNGNGAKRAAIRRLEFEMGIKSSKVKLYDI